MSIASYASCMLICRCFLQIGENKQMKYPEFGTLEVVAPRSLKPSLRLRDFKESELPRIRAALSKYASRHGWRVRTEISRIPPSYDSVTGELIYKGSVSLKIWRYE